MSTGRLEGSKAVGAKTQKLDKRVILSCLESATAKNALLHSTPFLLTSCSYPRVIQTACTFFFRGVYT